MEGYPAKRDWKRECKELEALVAKQAAVIKQMLNLIDAYHSPDHPLRLQALALQPCPEVLNKVRADAVTKAFAAMSVTSNDAKTYIRRIENGEA